MQVNVKNKKLNFPHIFKNIYLFDSYLLKLKTIFIAGNIFLDIIVFSGWNGVWSIEYQTAFSRFTFISLKKIAELWHSCHPPLWADLWVEHSSTRARNTYQISQVRLCSQGPALAWWSNERWSGAIQTQQGNKPVAFLRNHIRLFKPPHSV